MDLGLGGKTVVITGGSRGIGRAVVEGFVKEGASVVVGGVSLEASQELARQLTSSVATVLAIKTDVTRRSDVENLANVAMEHFGKIDILVNNAGVTKPVSFVDIDEAEWDRVMDINAKGVYMVTKAVVPYMMGAKKGKIVNIASGAAREGFAGLCHYAASKFAVKGLTQSLAKELASYNINVNALCPGIVHTFMWDQLVDYFAESGGIPKGKTFDETFARVCDKLIPMKRPQLPIDIANAVLFLSSEMSKNMTGQCVAVDGGLRMD